MLLKEVGKDRKCARILETAMRESIAGRLESTDRIEARSAASNVTMPSSALSTMSRKTRSSSGKMRHIIFTELQTVSLLNRSDKRA